MNRKGSFWVWISFSVLATIGLLELGLRLAFGLGSPVLVQADPEIGYLFQPNQTKVRFGNTIRINQFSQRSAPVTLPKPPQTLRILMTGDSILNGGAPIDQSQTITTLLEDHLREANRSVEVLNASAGSWGLGNQLAYLQRFGFLESNLLIIEIGGNDLTQPTSTSGLVGRVPEYPNRAPALAIQELIQRYLWPPVARWFKRAPAPSAIPTSADIASHVASNQQILKKIILLARSQNLPVFVVLVPQRYNLIPKQQISPEKLQFLEALKQSNTPVLDLQTLWSKQSAATVEAYFRDTDHFTPKGNQEIASQIYQKLCSKRPLVTCAPQ